MFLKKLSLVLLAFSVSLPLSTIQAHSNEELVSASDLTDIEQNLEQLKNNPESKSVLTQTLTWFKEHPVATLALLSAAGITTYGIVQKWRGKSLNPFSNGSNRNNFNNSEGNNQNNPKEIIIDENYCRNKLDRIKKIVSLDRVKEFSQNFDQKNTSFTDHFKENKLYTIIPTGYELTNTIMGTGVYKSGDKKMYIGIYVFLKNKTSQIINPNKGLLLGVFDDLKKKDDMLRKLGIFPKKENTLVFKMKQTIAIEKIKKLSPSDHTILIDIHLDQYDKDTACHKKDRE